mgnify:CR=1 FL=1
MKIAIVGNNDGPLYLLKSLRKNGLKAELVGLQKPVSLTLENKYLELVDKHNLYIGFEEAGLLEFLAKYNIDLLVNCFCNFKFVKLLEKYEVLNVHLSALPEYRGRHPLHWALINGEKTIGITIHKMTRDFDEGPIYWQKRLEAKSTFSVAEAREKLLKILQKELADFVVDYHQKKLNPKQNSDANSSLISRRSPKDSRIYEWNNRDLIYRKIWALSSEDHPAFIKINDRKIEIRHAEKTVISYGFAEGEIIQFSENTIEIACEKNKGILLKFDNQNIIFPPDLKTL